MTKRLRAVFQSNLRRRAARPRSQRAMARMRLVGAATLALVTAAAGHWIGAPPVSAQGAVPGPLSFFKNYFVTGDYVVRGVSLWRRGINGKALVNIPKLGGGPDGVPPTADILAAFLYVQTSEKIQGSGIDNAKFNGISLGPFTDPASGEPGSGTYALALPNWDQAMAPCWSTAFPPVRRLITYRTDVFRFLPIDPATGKQDLNVTQRLEVPDSGILFADIDEDGNEPSNLQGPRAIGASLVVIYRDPTKPYKGIVIHDGAFTKRAFQTMDQTINGWYQASTGAPKSANMTQIVGDGRLFLSERVKLNGQLIATNPFRSLNGPKWDNWRTNITLPNGADSATVRIEPHTLLSDCTHHSAWILETTVQDTDGDGLLDRWETENNIVDVKDPTGQALLPDLEAMGALPNRKDVFVDISFTHTDGKELTYGVPGPTNPPKPAHTHLLNLDALNMVGQAFERQGIAIHFAVGNNHQSSPYVIPASFAQGGKNISETMACAEPDNPSTPDVDESTIPIECTGPAPGQYPLHFGTTGWKTGFAHMMAILGFEESRRYAFRSILSTHAVGIPKEPCLNADGTANLVCQNGCRLEGATQPDPQCVAQFPNFADYNVPRTYSGIFDFPGREGMLTLGFFDDEDGLPVGTAKQQGGTLLHELGHGFELTHGGIQDPGVARRENCIPWYHSSMNYLYQLHLLSNQDGKLFVDLSGEAIDGDDENSLIDTSLGTPRYRSSWYAPKEGSYLESDALAKAATKHCDGSALLADDIEMVRIDGSTVVGDIDWNADGTIDATNPPQDVNFNGNETTLPQVPSDWANIRLNQLGGGRSPGGLYIDRFGRKAIGPMSLNIGKGDIGKGDIGKGDIGKGDIGKGDIGKGDIGKGDIGKGDIGTNGIVGKGDIGRGLFGGGDTDVGAPGEPFVELDLETVQAMSGDAPTPPNELEGCVTDGEGACVPEGQEGDLPVRLDWQAGHERAVSYSVYRFAYDPEAPFPPADLPSEPIAIVDDVDDETGRVVTSYLDDFACGGPNLAYFIKANFADESSSAISNFATVVTPVTICFEDLGVEVPPSTLGDQTMTPFNDTRACGVNVTSVPSPLGGDIAFVGTSLSHRTANTPEGPCLWATWSHGFTGDVYFNYVGDGRDATTLTMTMPPGTTGFYFYAEPNIRDPFFFTITTSDGQEFVTSTGVEIDGEGGARGFAFYTDFATIANIVVTTTAAAEGFAVGEFGIARRFAPPPIP